MMTSTYKVTYYKPNVGGSRSMNVQAEYHSEAEDLVRGMVPGADIINSQEVKNAGDSATSAMDIGGSAVILGALLAIGVIIAYWHIVLPVALIIGIFWYFINNN
jgi:hypothetical protein